MTDKFPISLKNKFLADAAALYEAAFPEDERRATDEFLRLIGDGGRFHVDGFTDGNGRFAGFMSYWTWPDFRYIEHFAVDASMRGGGIGARMLRQFIDSDPRPVIIEVEPPSAGEMAARRVGFYERAGMRLSDAAYTQPPYGEGRKPVELRLMTCGGITLTAGDERIARIRREVYGTED